ncbi:GlxA family transcriptional regulator [Halofilum ochraceum]|uniref:GlxA family transcriptional regulator n=1 Tax=Halofilum ochraceum TaxID=1611323 RepID=UPI001C302E59|nr:helix-turn-helix domain-containing protein [Halofilum ochraceum]
MADKTFFRGDPVRGVTVYNVTVVLVEGGMPSTAVAPLEVFSTAGVLWHEMRGEEPAPRFRVRTASRDGRAVRTAVNLRLDPICAFDDVESSDIVIVSAIGANIESACTANAALYPWLRDQHARGATVAGVCAGAALVAEAGLLDGRPATTHWGVAETCRHRYPAVRWLPERLITESDGILCSGGVYASVDLSLYLTEKFCGHAVAVETARALLLETPRTWQNGYAAQPPETVHEDTRVREAQEWMFRHFTDVVRIDALAEHAGMSPRTFARRFKLATGETPMQYLHRLRVNAARHLLENELKSVGEVCTAVGYDDVAYFRRLFRRHTGSTPRQYRERFGGGSSETVALDGRVPHH